VGKTIRRINDFSVLRHGRNGAWHACCLYGVTGRHTPPKPDRRTIVNYTHYDYLDLAPGASTARIEIAYAAVLERFNYGASDVGQDLSGLVRMIHAAYEVLSNSERRRRYDEQLAAQAADADAELKLTLDSQPVVAMRRVQDVPEPLRAIHQALAA
jgi:hypothetical protein